MKGRIAASQTRSLISGAQAVILRVEDGQLSEPGHAWYTTGCTARDSTLVRLGARPPGMAWPGYPEYVDLSGSPDFTDGLAGQVSPPLACVGEQFGSNPGHPRRSRQSDETRQGKRIRDF